jgi:acyl-CoA synthetase (AMP-forming)/AMP-acid ligase II
MGGDRSIERRANLGDALRRQAARNSKKPAIVEYAADGQRREVSYPELDRASDRLARSLVRAGVDRGDVIAMMSANRLEYVIGYYGALKAQACFTGLSPALTDRELAYQIDHAEPRFIISDAEGTHRLTGLAETEGIGLVTFGGQSIDFVGLPEPAPDPLPEVEETDTALLVYTSGTESTPKGVVLPHRNFLIATTPSWVVDGYVIADDVFLLLAPMYTMAGIGTVTNLMSIGATMVVTERIKPDTVIDIIAAEQVTNTSQTPTFYAQMAAAPRFASADLGSLRQCHTYGGPIPRSVVEAFNGHANHIEWATYWGQSELSQLGIVGFYRDLDEVPDQDMRWIGRPMAAVEVRVVGEDGEPAEVGELLCGGPAIMNGYHKDPELTRSTIVDGWLRTGDIVRIDEDANIFFFDRKKDVIKTGGMNVSSLEVENVLLACPEVTDVAVVGLPDEYWSEVVTAFVVTDDDPLDTDRVLDRCRRELASYKIPKQITVIDELPRDGQGKVVNMLLREHGTRRVG